MNNLKIITLHAAVALVLLCSCRGGKATAVIPDGDTVRLRHAERLQIVKYDGYAVASLADPWNEGRTLHIYSDDLSRELVCHEVTWSRKDAWCEGQWSAAAQPEELPSQPVTTTVSRVAPPVPDPAFARFDFGRAVM